MNAEDEPIFIRRDVEASKQLGFYFQGKAGRMMMDPFTFLRNAGALKRNMVLFRCPGLQFYHGRLHPGWPDIETTISLLGKLRNTFAKDLFHACVGTSMGGYAAILFGHYLRADVVHAFSATTRIDPCSPVIDVGPQDVPEAHRDLAQLLEHWNGRTRYHLYFNDGHEKDRQHAERLACCPGVELHSAAGTSHSFFEDRSRLTVLAQLFPADSVATDQEQEAIDELLQRLDSQSLAKRRKRQMSSVAKAVFQDNQHATVNLLRRFRDEVLVNHPFGHVLIKAYRIVERPLAYLVNLFPWCRPTLQKLLRRLAANLR